MTSDILKPQLCHTLELDGDGKPILPGFGWVMEPKLDGNRLIAHHRHVGIVDLYGGRNGTPWTESSLEPIRRALAAALSVDTIVDGELMVPTTRASSGDVAHAVASGGRMEVWLFDVLRVGGQDVRSQPWTQRREYLDALYFTGLAKVTPVAEPSLALAEQWLEIGLEGIVCKHKDAPYQSGKRSHNVLKWKPQATLEGRIIGFVEGKNGNAGNIGALVIEIEDSGVETKVSCPPELSREILRDAGCTGLYGAFERIWQGSAYLGRCLEMKHYGIFPSGSPRHPGFLRLRPDRD